MSGPSDQLFRYGYKHLEVAEAALRYNLPPELVAAVDWATLRYESEIIIDSERETLKDVLLSARLLGSHEGDPPHFFLIEHQTTVPRLMVWRLLDYTRRIIERYLEHNPKSRRIPEVTVLVVYARKGRSWWAARRLEALYGPKGGRRPWGKKRSGLSFSYYVDDMPSASDEQVMERPGPVLGQLLLLVLSYAGTPELARRIPTWRALFARVYAGAYGLRKLYRVLYFLQQRGDEAACRATERVVHSLMEKEKAEKLMRSVADVIEAKNRRKWLAEGMAKGLAMALFNVLAAKGLHVDDSSRQIIESCKDPATFERWLKRVLVATRLEDVLDGPAQ